MTKVHDEFHALIAEQIATDQPRYGTDCGESFHADLWAQGLVEKAGMSAGAAASFEFDHLAQARLLAHLHPIQIDPSRPHLAHRLPQDVVNG